MAGVAEVILGHRNTGCPDTFISIGLARQAEAARHADAPFVQATLNVGGAADILAA